jgi:ketosteroid isomerase-like protein
MSQENVEIVRRGWAVFIEGMDHGNLTAGFDEGLFAPTYALTPAQAPVGAKPYVGRDGFAEWMREWTEDFLDWKIKPVTIIDAGNDRVVTVVDQAGRGKGSGAVVELRFGIVFTVKAGQIVEQRNYVDPAEALEAVGLAE